MAFLNEYIIKGEITEIHFQKKKELGFCIIDTEDLQRLIEFDKTWFPHFNYSNKKYYIHANINLVKGKGKKYKNSTISLQTFLLDTRTGSKKDRIIVDHKDHDPFNNRKENLRIITNEENSKYRKGKNSNNKSGYRNVSWNGNGWSVQLQVEGKSTVLKRFKKDKLEDAGVFAEEMRQKYYGEFAGGT